MRRKVLWTLVALSLVLGAGLYVFPSGPESRQRPDCPGTIVCPISGRVVCIDRCPLGATRSDESHRPACCRKAVSGTAAQE